MHDLDGDGGGVLQLHPFELLQLVNQRIPGWALVNKAWIRKASQTQTNESYYEDAQVGYAPSQREAVRYY